MRNRQQTHTYWQSPILIYLWVISSSNNTVSTGTMISE